jgi:hypothetical protein
MASNSRAEISPGSPLLITMSSPFQPSAPTGVMTAAVPQPNTSPSLPARCAAISSSMPIGRSCA